MKEAIGKWLMDVSKYMVTAILLSSVFGDMEKWWVVLLAVVASALTLSAGLWLIHLGKKQ